LTVLPTNHIANVA